MVSYLKSVTDLIWNLGKFSYSYFNKQWVENWQIARILTILCSLDVNIQSVIWFMFIDILWECRSTCRMLSVLKHLTSNITSGNSYRLTIVSKGCWSSSFYLSKCVDQRKRYTERNSSHMFVRGVESKWCLKRFLSEMSVEKSYRRTHFLRRCLRQLIDIVEHRSESISEQNVERSTQR